LNATSLERRGRATYLSGFVYLLPAPDRVRLDRAILALLDSDDGLPDRDVILRAVDQVWPRATTGESRARSLLLPGTPGRGRQAGRLRAALRAVSSNGPTVSTVAAAQARLVCYSRFESVRVALLVGRLSLRHACAGCDRAAGQYRVI
jgi:hypothetical protein